MTALINALLFVGERVAGAISALEREDIDAAQEEIRNAEARLRVIATAGSGTE